MKLNTDWHQNNKMPPNATLEQRLKWHLEHSKNCACRAMPQKIAQEIRKREGQNSP